MTGSARAGDMSDITAITAAARMKDPIANMVRSPLIDRPAWMDH
jgi:hypothetical protein